MSVRFGLLLCCIGFTSSSVFTQEQTIDKYSLAAGVGFPSGPEAFHDYWNTGLLISAGYQTSLVPAMDLLVSVDYSSFSLNKERFFKGIELDPSSNSISGGGTSIVALLAHARYAPPGQEYLHFFFLGGFGVALSSIAESRATYSGLSVHQKSESYVSTLVSLGGGIDLFTSESWSLSIDGRFQISVTRPERANASQTSLRVRIIRSL